MFNTVDIKNIAEGENIVSFLQRELVREVREAYPEVYCDFPNNLITVLWDVFQQTGDTFIFIIDEWDCLLREAPDAKIELREYLHFLRDILKDKPYVALAYMTGILPVRKYGTQSVLNMFDEFSVLTSGPLSTFMGFTDDEVKSLCAQHNMDSGEIEKWYDGYIIDDVHIYNPRSVVSAIQRKKCDNYWTQTESFRPLLDWINLDFGGLHQSLVKMLTGEHERVNVIKFSNSLYDLQGRDDVLTLLIHLGYLGYLREEGKAYIPNYEINQVFAATIDGEDWKEVAEAINCSQDLLESTWDKNGEAVAQSLDETYFEDSVLTYHNENSLACRLVVAYYTAKRFYTIVREMPAGKGYADLVCLPDPKHADKPAMVIELKWNKPVETAIEQIKRQGYYRALRAYKGNLLLVGISYDKGTKRHSCIIEEMKTLFEKFRATNGTFKSQTNLTRKRGVLRCAYLC